MLVAEIAICYGRLLLSRHRRPRRLPVEEARERGQFTVLPLYSALERSGTRPPSPPPCHLLQYSYPCLCNLLHPHLHPRPLHVPGPFCRQASFITAPGHPLQGRRPSQALLPPDTTQVSSTTLMSTKLTDSLLLLGSNPLIDSPTADAKAIGGAESINQVGSTTVTADPPTFLVAL